MCCSSAELNLPGGNHDGIMEFPAETPTGAFLRDVLPGEKPETVRNQFIEAWLRQQKRKEEQANMRPFLPPALKEKVKALAEGEGV